MEAAPDNSLSGTEPVRTPGQIFMGRLLRNRVAVTGAIMLAVLYSCAVFASFLAPYDGTLSNIDMPDHPPAPIHFFDHDGHFHFRPFIYETPLISENRRTYRENYSVIYPIHFFTKGDSYKLWWLFEGDRHLFGLGPPIGKPTLLEAGQTSEPNEPRPLVQKIYLFGSDRIGRDLFSRILSGSRISLSVGLIGILITMVLSLLVGGISGYVGGVTDAFLMRFVELLMSIPGLYMILALRSGLSQPGSIFQKIFRLKEDEPLNSGQIYILIVAILGLVSWGGSARVIRGMVLSLKKLDYISAARAMGASPFRIITKHLLPNTFTYVIISATLSIPYYILGEVALSYLGVGIEEPMASWGNMLHEAQSIRVLVNFPWVMIPGIFIFLTVFAFNFFGDGIRDALDPRYLK